MKRSDIKRRPLADTVLASLEPETKEYRVVCPGAGGQVVKRSAHGYPSLPTLAGTSSTLGMCRTHSGR
ncbi:hypothetical protein D3880_17040 [Pseudomonas cavernae]|uniref:Uncharacterized protein n=1 Tax=Pseudomonas cavernae TaxID=2320867 RepID=A0A385Z627_9PSED|nr:hypothetical protein D3880_17040 [Pseudomonas cavernae]